MRVIVDIPKLPVAEELHPDALLLLQPALNSIFTNDPEQFYDNIGDLNIGEVYTKHMRPEYTAAMEYDVNCTTCESSLEAMRTSVLVVASQIRDAIQEIKVVSAVSRISKTVVEITLAPLRADDPYYTHLDAYRDPLFQPAMQHLNHRWNS